MRIKIEEKSPYITIFWNTKYQKHEIVFNLQKFVDDAISHRPKMAKEIVQFALNVIVPRVEEELKVSQNSIKEDL